MSVQALSARVDAAKNKMRTISDEIDGLAVKLAEGNSEKDYNQAMARLRSGFNKAEAEYLAARSEWEKGLRAAIDTGEMTPERGDGFGPAPHVMNRVTADQPVTGREKPAELRSKALATIERGGAFSYASDGQKEAATRAVEQSEDGVAAHIARFGTQTYADAFRSWFTDPDGFAATATAEARAALREGMQETRATLQTSGAVLPSPLEAQIWLDGTNGVEGSLKADVRKVTTTSNTWRGISSAGVTAGFAAEASEQDDDTPTLAGVTITTRRADALAIVTLEVLQDQVDFMEQIGMMFSDAKQNLDEQVIWNGASGSNQPIGLWTAIDGGSYEIAPTTAETFTWEDTYKLAEALPARFRNRGKFYLELSTFHELHKSQIPGSTTNPVIFEDGKLIGRDYALASTLDAYSDVNPAATADNPILLYGDLGVAYVWVDRLGLSVFPPQLMQNSNALRFDGTVGVPMFYRAGGDVLVDGAAAILNVSTTA